MASNCLAVLFGLTPFQMDDQREAALVIIAMGGLLVTLGSAKLERMDQSPVKIVNGQTWIGVRV